MQARKGKPVILNRSVNCRRGSKGGVQTHTCSVLFLGDVGLDLRGCLWRVVAVRHLAISVYLDRQVYVGDVEYARWDLYEHCDGSGRGHCCKSEVTTKSEGEGQ